MRISLFADASLRAMMLLSAADRALTTRQIAEAVGVAYNHVSKAVQQLAELGLVDTARGRGGGVRLSEGGHQATVGELLRALNTSKHPASGCTGGVEPCPLYPHCRLRVVLNRAWESFYRELDDVRITELPEPATTNPLLLRLPSTASIDSGTTDPAITDPGNSLSCRGTSAASTLESFHAE